MGESGDIEMSASVTGRLLEGREGSGRAEKMRRVADEGAGGDVVMGSAAEQVAGCSAAGGSRGFEDGFRAVVERYVTAWGARSDVPVPFVELDKFLGDVDAIPDVLCGADVAGKTPAVGASSAPPGASAAGAARRSNSAPTPQEKFACDVCSNVFCNSEAVLKVHKAGKQHQRKEEALRTQANRAALAGGAQVVPRNETEGSTVTAASAAPRPPVAASGCKAFRCDLCGVQCSGSAQMDAHLKGRQHSKKEKALNPG